MGAVADRGLAYHFDGMLAQVARDFVQVAGLDGEAYVIDVEAVLGARMRSWNEINHAAAGAKLDESDLVDSALFAEAEDSRVKVEGAILIAAS